MNSEIIIGSDHAAFDLKEKIKDYLFQTGVYVEDIGTFSEASVDYPDFGTIVASSISEGDYERGILLCGTGIGMSMVANRFKGVRAALCFNVLMATMSRKHNDSNLLVFGARIMDDINVVIEMLEAWLETPFEGGRHEGRLLKMENI